VNELTSAAPSRRSFLRKTLGVAAAGGISLAGLGRLRADTHVPFEVNLQGEGWDSHGRKTIIGQSLWVINHRFLDAKVIANGLYVDGTSYNQEGDLWQITNLGAHKPNYGYPDILLYQLVALRGAARRPTLNIILSHKPDSNAVGWANTNLVKVKFSAETHTVEGEFKVYLNSHFLGGGGHYSDPYYWAGTIAHEMLHNLGHLHVTDRESPQYARCQLIAHERAVYYNGNYRRGMERPVVLCGGRWHG
jgi:hypothetical protein